MPSDDTQSSQHGDHVSQRSVIRGAATAGAAGLAATAFGAALSPGGLGQHPGRVQHRPAAADAEVKAPAGPIVVHVRNAKSGDIEVFSGTSQTRLRDKDLAARIARAIG